MSALTDAQRGVLAELFTLRGFQHMYSLINAYYSQYGLGIGLSDDERIEEYQWITKQLRKYVSTKQDEILECGGNLDEMRARVHDMLSNAVEYGGSRREQMYIFVRDNWLRELLGGIEMLMEDDDLEEES